MAEIKIEIENSKNSKMQNKHEVLIKEDQQDVDRLTEHVEKIEKLKNQFNKQKDEIGSLKNIICQLKNQNQELKVKNADQDSLDEVNDQRLSDRQDDQDQQRREGQIRYKSQRKSIDKSKGKGKNAKKGFRRVQNQESQHKYFSKTFSNDKKANLNLGLEQDPQENYQSANQPKTKLWNRSIDKYHRKNTSSAYTATGTKFKYTHGISHHMNEDYCRQPSLRNHSGFISSTKVASPVHRPKNETFRLRNQLQNQNFSDETDQDQIKLDITNLSTKTKLINNLISDLQIELQQTQCLLQYESSSHCHTKSVLQSTLAQNASLSQQNNSLLIQFQLVNKENEYLKQQLVRMMEEKNRMKWEYENGNEEARKFRVQVGMRVNREFEEEMRVMDGIYRQFQGLWKGNNRLF